MFVLNLIRWFVGYVVFTVEGNGQERFVNLCARFGYTIWNVRRKEYFFVSISRTKYRMLKNLAKQTGVKIRIYKNMVCHLSCINFRISKVCWLDWRFSLFC